MDIFYVERQKKFVEPLVVELSNYVKIVFNDSFARNIYKNNPDELNSAMSFIVESYKRFTRIFDELLDRIDLDKYEGEIDDKLFSITRDLYFNLCLFVDNEIRMDEIILQQTRPSLFLQLEKTSKINEYQSDITGDNIEKLHKKMLLRFKELFPE